jgi:hypothetical protein
VTGGSRAYVQRLIQPFADRIQQESGVVNVRRDSDRVTVTDVHGESRHFDRVILAVHANQALAIIDQPTRAERELLGAFRYSRNLAVLHSDPTFMPRRRRAWSSWNYVGRRDQPGGHVGVTYWMNRLQNIPEHFPLFVTLNPEHPPHADTLHATEIYEHPIFDAAAIAAQRRLWSLQGNGNLWFCGAHFGAGFHEDGLQSALAVAEQLGDVRRPWTVSDESGRIAIAADIQPAPEPELQP